MYFAQIYLRSVRDIYTWHSETLLKPGARVALKFRGRPRQGIVISVSTQKPEFKTQPIDEVWDEQFVPETWIKLAQWVAEKNFTSISQVMSLVVPEKFLLQRDPVVREKFWSLTGNEFETLKGAKQKVVIARLLISEATDGELRDIASPTVLKNLAEKGIISVRLGNITPATQPDFTRPVHELSPAQQEVLENISHSKKPSLLLGVTGSGKTEIYKKLAEKVVEKGNQVLILLPEIALTPQLIAEFRSVGSVAVWHSKLSEGERIQEWARCVSGEAQILIGARSAALIPLPKVKLIVLDEEHEWTFKSETAPRLWTHDVAEWLSLSLQTKLVFGSATPRLESWMRCQKGEWNRVDLLSRINETELPKIQFVDMRNELKFGNYGPLSSYLAEAIGETVEEGKQVVLFLNRRGFSGSTTCRMCGETYNCPHCDMPMKLHRNGKNARMICHVCGHLAPFTDQCPHCEATDFIFRGWGTQKVEQVLKEDFPGLRVLRADADSIGGKHDFRRLCDKFSNHEADVLLGTQMVAKGLDFEKVALVGVILADVGLSLPDFRAEERAFQLLTQVSGRAGRRKTQGNILIQTFKPDEKVFSFVKKHDTGGFLDWQKESREATKLPPFGSIAKIGFSHVDKKVSFELAQSLFRAVRKRTDCKANFAPAFWPRTHGKYHFRVFIQTETKEELYVVLRSLSLPMGAKIDVNPASLL